MTTIADHTGSQYNRLKSGKNWENVC